MATSVDDVRDDRPHGARWFEILLAAVLLAVLAAAAVSLAVWLYPGAGEAAGDAEWRTGSRAMVFAVVMLVACAIGLVAFAVYVFTRGRDRPAASAARPAAAAATTAAESVETPSGTRLVGILLLAVAFLLLNWIYLEPAVQYTLVLQVLYPATLAVALVMLFDKATRAWSVKTAAESVREWLLCDGIVFLLLLGYLNLLGSAAGEVYASMFWDVLHVVLFFFTFWMLDRKVTRLRFLVAYGYLILVPVLLLVWRTVQGVEAPEDLSWWSTIWPFFILAIIFFVLEVVFLLASRGAGGHGIAAIKDALFIVLAGATLIIAMPESGG